jgi:hypothetical protein
MATIVPEPINDQLDEYAEGLAKAAGERGLAKRLLNLGTGKVKAAERERARVEAAAAAAIEAEADVEGEADGDGVFGSLFEV